MNPIPAKSEFKIKPRIAKINDNPNTNRVAFRRTSRRLNRDSVMDVPAKYARSPGTNGKTQGDENDTTPAMKLMISVNPTMKIRSTNDDTDRVDNMMT